MSGAVVWFVGLPSSGKSTLASAVSEGLRKHGRPTCILDGDEVRAAIAPHPGYSPTERDNFYATLANLAALLARQGLIVLVPATASLRAYRERARRLAPRFVEVFVDTPLEICRQRDSKGLYARAQHGKLGNLPGTTALFEPPANRELRLSGHDLSADAARVVRHLCGSVFKVPS